MGLFSVIGGIFGGGAQKKASQKAMEAQTAALNRATDIGSQQFQQTRQDYMPYTQAGTAAIGQYGNLLGANGAGAQGLAVEGLKADPFFQQNLADANTNLLQTASATGGVRGGNTAGAVGQLSPALLQSYYQNALSGYGNLAQLGLGATGSVASFGANNAQNAGQNAIGVGQAQAANYLTKGGINAANFNNIGGLLDGAAKAGSAGGGFSLQKALGSIF